MRSVLRSLLRPWLGAGLLAFSSGRVCAAEPTLANEQCRVTLQANGDVIIATRDGATETFRPHFLMLASAEDPNLETKWGKFKDAGLSSGDTGSTYHLLTWGRKSAAVGPVGHVADGYDPASDRHYGPGRSPNLFTAAPATPLQATTGRVENGRIVWALPSNERVAAQAELDLPEDGSLPRLTLTARVKSAGWYSFGYVGAPARALADVQELWQPLVYNERRLPEGPYLEAAFRCPLPTTLVTHDDTTLGVVADPVEYPFQPLPNFANSRFGVALRNREGQVQPMLFAPILGGAGSRLEAGATFTFRHRLLLTRTGLSAAYEGLARTLFGFADVRHNALGSLNQTLDRMTEFGLSAHAKFNRELRGFSYDTDVPGSVKNVSALHPLGVALVRDDARIYEQLAYPQIEYFISRERFLFTTDPKVTGQSVSARLGGLGAPLSEYATLYALSGRRTPFFLTAARQLVPQTRILNLQSPLRGEFWANSLALYRATGERSWLERAMRDADAYLRTRVDTPQTDFEDPDSRGLFFWPSFVPQWIELLELYEETRESRYLAAAHAGARAYAQFVWLSPRIPDGNVTVNQDGFGPAYRTGPKFPRTPFAPETVPAWRASEIGLTSESSGTSRGARGIFLTCWAPWMLRIAALTDDTFLHDIARSAIIGRYTSFPGYHLNTTRSTAYEKPDFAEKPKEQLNAMTSIHYNHIWPHIAMLLDYLVTDAFAKSRGAVDFPSRYAEGYGYLQQKIYGDRPGRVYDAEGLFLWMPSGAVDVTHPELNYVLARGENEVALVLTNQSREPLSSRVRFSPEHLRWTGDAASAPLVQVRENGLVQPTRRLSADGSIEVAVAAEGITVVRVRGVTPRVQFQNRFLADSPPLPAGSDLQLGFQGVRATALRFGGDDQTRIYVYLPDHERTVTKCVLRWQQGGRDHSVTDTSFPYDFTLQAESSAPVDFTLELTHRDGRVETSPRGRVELR